MGNDDGDREDLVARLLERLAAGDSEIPTTLLGRARRAGSTALRTGSGALLGRLRGAEGLDPDSVARLVTSLGELKGVAMKAGQILGYLDTSLPEETRRVLAVLQTRSQPTRFEEIERVLREDFGARADELIESIERTPVATASIGQVHRSRLGGTDVAVKVLQPGVEQAIRSDFRAAGGGKWLAKLLMPGGEVDSVIDEARETFLAECDYDAERRAQERFGELYADHPSISIPGVFSEWCSRRVLTTGWREGIRSDEFAARASQAARDRAGRSLYEFYVGSVYRHGLFNGDPHPGNLLFGEDGSLVVLDHGCVREFDDALRVSIIALSRAVRADDSTAIRQALAALGGAVPDDEVFPTVRSLLRGFFGPALQAGPHRVNAGFDTDLGAILRDKRAVLRMRLSGKMLFLFRIRFGLHSELAKLGSVVDWASLEEELSS